MNAIEQEIVEKFRLLDKDARRRVLLQIQGEVDTNQLMSMSPGEWLAWAQGFGKYIHDKYGRLAVSSTDLLHEAREERLDDLLGGS